MRGLLILVSSLVIGCGGKSGGGGGGSSEESPTPEEQAGRAYHSIRIVRCRMTGEEDADS